MEQANIIMFWRKNYRVMLLRKSEICSFNFIVLKKQILTFLSLKLTLRKHVLIFKLFIITLPILC